jgi:hypothetical protein
VCTVSPGQTKSHKINVKSGATRTVNFDAGATGPRRGMKKWQP